jgi:predicted esterase
MFKYLRDVEGIAPADILVHGYSLGGPIAASLVKTRAKKGIQIRGLVLHSAMPSAPEAAADGAGEDMTDTPETQTALGDILSGRR